MAQGVSEQMNECAPLADFVSAYLSLYVCRCLMHVSACASQTEPHL